MKQLITVAASACFTAGAFLALGQTPAPKAPAKPAAKPAAAAAAKAAPKAAAAKPASAPSPADVLKSANDPYVIKIGAAGIRKSEWEQFLAGLPEQVKAQATGPDKRRIAESYGELMMLAGEARKRGLDQDAKNKAQMKFQADQFLASTLFRELQNTVTVDDAAVLAYYNEHKNEYEEVKARHILIRFKDSKVPLKPGQKDLTKEEALAKAKELKAKIEGGGDFAALAKSESDDTGSGAAGGDLGKFGRGQMVPQFETAAFAQPVGKVGEPVESPFGYHLILVEEHKSKALDEMKEEISNRLKPDMAKKQVENLKKGNPVVVDEAYFGGAAAPPAQ